MTDQQMIGAALAVIAIAIVYSSRTKRVSIDRALWWWTHNDPVRVRDLLNGGILILGMTGSGKSSSSGKQIARALVRDRQSFGLILAAKPEDLPMWTDIFRKTGQSKRLLVFDGAKSRLRMNFLEEAARYGGDTREITKCITTIGETLASGDRGRGGENAAFFLAQQERLIHFASEVLRAGVGKVTSSELHRFITSAALTREELSSERWRGDFHNKCIQAAHKQTQSARGRHDLMQAIDYFLGEYPSMADRTRSSILAGVMGTLFVFNSGLVHDLVSTKTNFTFDQMRRRRQWLLVNLAPSEYGDSGRFIGAGFKYLFQRYILRLAAKPSDPFHVCWCDEAQNWTNKFDAEYLAQCRSHRGCMVFLTQSVHSFHTAMQSEDAKQQTLSLLGNFNHRIFHALGDVETAQWASELLGRRLETHFGGSTQPAESVFDQLFGVNRSTASCNTQYEPVLQPSVFMNGLRNGGPRNGHLCDAVILRPGMRFSNGENYLITTFSQR